MAENAVKKKEYFPAREWVSEDSEKYEKVLLFNDHDKKIMHTQPGQKIDCEVGRAYAYLTKSGKLVIGLVPVVQFIPNMANHPLIAGECIVNDIVAVDTVSKPKRYLIDHRSFISLDDLNHIIDLNRPDVLDPKFIYENQQNFKQIAKLWHDHHWINDKLYQSVLNVQDGRPDLVPEEVVRAVSNHMGFRRTLSEWREANWISTNKAKQYAITGQPLKTIDDELSFATTID